MQINTTLYKQSSKDAVQQWSVFAEGNKVTVEYGQVDGKFQTKDTYVKGKNVGRSNETTDEAQAIKEAESKWNKQVKKGYVEDPSGERSVLLPMKVESYFKGKMKDKIEFPATTSRKLNGLNGEARIKEGLFTQLSRGGEEYPLPFKAAVSELEMLMDILDVDSLNYEIYKHGEYLQDITGAVKAPTKHKDLWEKLEYYVFDLPTDVGTWKERLAKLQAVNMTGFKYVRIVTAREVNSHEEIIQYQDSFVAEGYEGSIVRNYKGEYNYNTRTMDVLKVKYVQSEEFKVKSWIVDKNKHPVFICEAEGGLFKVKPKGTTQQRGAMLAQAPNYIDNWMTVEFEMFSKDGIPLKPVGIGLREGIVDEEGNFFPTE